MTRLLPALWPLCALRPLAPRAAAAAAAATAAVSKTDGGDDGACGTADGGAARPTARRAAAPATARAASASTASAATAPAPRRARPATPPARPASASFVANGAPERSSDLRGHGRVSTCGLDGTCDGQGHCRKHPAGTVCKPGTCDGASVSDIDVCDGAGTLQGRSRDDLRAVQLRSGDQQVRDHLHAPTPTAPAGIMCVNGSCGPKPNGAVCVKDSECASGFCADGVCCNVALQGRLRQLQPAGPRAEPAGPIDVGAPDPHGVCRTRRAATCGTTGACDGIGGCARYRGRDRLHAAVVQRRPAEHGRHLQRARQLPAARGAELRALPVRGRRLHQPLHQRRRLRQRARLPNGSCGQKTNGQPCPPPATARATTASTASAATSACTGPCRSCALPSPLGPLHAVAAGGDDPREHLRRPGRRVLRHRRKVRRRGRLPQVPRRAPSAPPSTARTTSTRPSRPATRPATASRPTRSPAFPSPATAAQCFGSCTADAQLLARQRAAPATRAARSRTAPSARTAASACRATARRASAAPPPARAPAGPARCPGTMGACTNVADRRPDPGADLRRQGAATCGTNGKCEAGACQKYAQGTPCAGRQLPGEHDAR